MISAISHLSRLARAGFVFAREGVLSLIDPTQVPVPAHTASRATTNLVRIINPRFRERRSSARHRTAPCGRCLSQPSAAAWVTLYTSDTSRTADAGRSITTDPTPGSGVVAEVITSTNQTVYFAPAVVGYTINSSLPATTIPLKVYNNDPVNTVTISVNVTLVQIEQ